MVYNDQGKIDIEASVYHIFGVSKLRALSAEVLGNLELQESLTPEECKLIQDLEFNLRVRNST